MADTNIRYVWTATDQDAYDKMSKDPPGPCAGYPQCNNEAHPHQCFATPYGLPATSAHEIGAEIPIDLKSSVKSVKATRFHVNHDWIDPQGIAMSKADGVWADFAVPDDIKTMGALCKHLVETNPNLYPQSIYGDVKTASRMLFDYWGNTRHRYEATAEIGPTIWTKYYTADPASLPTLTKKSVLAQVVSLEHELPKVNAGPNVLVTTGPDPLELRIGKYIDDIMFHVGTIEARMKTSREVGAERHELLRKLHAVQVIGEVAKGSDGYPSNGPKVAAAIGEWDDDTSLIGRLRVFLNELPATHGGRMQAATRLLGEVSPFTRDAAADAHESGLALVELLQPSTVNAQLLADFTTLGGDVAEEIATELRFPLFEPEKESIFDPTPRSKRAALYHKLGMAKARGTIAIAECGLTPDGYLEALDAAPLHHARSRKDIMGQTPREVFLSIGGRSASFLSLSFGNLAGPPSFTVALLQARTERALVALAKTKDFAAFEALAKDITSRIPPHLVIKEGLTTAEIEEALRGEPSAVKALTTKLGAAKASVAQRAPVKNGIAVLFQLLAAGFAFVQANEDDGSDGFVHVTNWINFSLAGSSAINGIADTALDLVQAGKLELGRVGDWLGRIANAETAISTIGKVGNFLGAFTAILGIVTSTWTFIQAIESRDARQIVSASIGLLGAGASIYVAYLMMKGAASGGALLVANGIALACLVATGVLSIPDIEKALADAPAKWASAILAELRAASLVQAFEQLDENSAAMKSLEELCGTTMPPTYEDDEAAKIELQNVGLDADAIKDICSAGHAFGDMLPTGS